MHINDLRNLLVLARKGLSVLSEGLPAEEAEAAWGSVKNAEAFINQIAQQAQAQQQVEGGEDPTQVHVVDLDAEDEEETASE